MDLTPGARLGHYEILAPIGKGGMGEVYKARDPRLGREVAIKVSSKQFSERFDREARVIASLNHANICTLYDVGPDYLVMEFVEGETLSARIKTGAIPLDESLRIATQIADALSAAHAKGVTHRDLKPGNIMLKPDGTVKVLDFGLAKVGRTSTSEAPDESPTLTMGMTDAGIVLGTAAYMPPEQARGKPVDKRADIWAFGAVLYEMLTGKRLFAGSTVTDVLAAVIEREPDLTKLPVKTRPLLRSCLQKDPANRLHDIADWKLLVLEPEEGGLQPAQALRPVPNRLWPAIAATALLVAAALAFLHFRETPPAAELTRFQLAVPAESDATSTYLALSPDGRQLIFTANEGDGIHRLWIRSMDTLVARVIPGTENARSPFWSPDSRSIGFTDVGKIKKVDASGGAPPVTLAEVQGNAGMGSWNSDGTIIFGNRVSNGGISRVSASGGPVTRLTQIDPARKEAFHSFPVFLPDGKHFIYLRSAVDSDNQPGIFVGSLDTKPEDPPSEMLVATPLGAVFVPSKNIPENGRLLFLRDGTLMTQPFDASTLKLAGEPVPIAEGVGFGGSVGYFTASTTGTLAYKGGGGVQRQLSWYDRKGAQASRAGDIGAYAEIAMSPDGTRVAARRDDGQADLWLFEFARSSSTRFTFDARVDRFPVWSPDGSQIAYCNGGNAENLQIKASSNANDSELLLQAKAPTCPQDFSRDGRYLLYVTSDPRSLDDLYLLPLTGEKKPVPFLVTQFSESQAKISPDGRWVTYRSNESGRREIYVRPLILPEASKSAPPGGKWMVSNGGGHQPRWNRNGKELLYLADNGTIMSVDVEAAGAVFKAGVPKRLFDVPVYPTVVGSFAPNWDLTPDGQKFLVTTLVGANTSPPITVVLNWETALRK